MAKKQVVCCDVCNKVIPEASDAFDHSLGEYPFYGLTVSGNISVVGGGGIVGNNFAEDGRVIHEPDYCLQCFWDVTLGQTRFQPKAKDAP